MRIAASTAVPHIPPRPADPLQALVQAHQSAPAATLGRDRLTALVEALHQIFEDGNSPRP